MAAGPETDDQLPYASAEAAEDWAIGATEGWACTGADGGVAFGDWAPLPKTDDQLSHGASDEAAEDWAPGAAEGWAPGSLTPAASALLFLFARPFLPRLRKAPGWSRGL